MLHRHCRRVHGAHGLVQGGAPRFQEDHHYEKSQVQESKGIRNGALINDFDQLEKYLPG